MTSRTSSESLAELSQKLVEAKEVVNLLYKCRDPAFLKSVLCTVLSHTSKLDDFFSLESMKLVDEGTLEVERELVNDYNTFKLISLTPDHPDFPFFPLRLFAVIDRFDDLYHDSSRKIPNLSFGNVSFDQYHGSIEGLWLVYLIVELNREARNRKYPATDAELLNEQGLSYKQSGNLKQAIKTFSLAIRSSHDFVQPIMRLANCFVDSGKYAESLPLFDGLVCLEGHPLQKNCLYNRAWALALMHRVDGSIDLCKQCLKVDPNYKPALSLLAQLSRIGPDTILITDHP